MDSKTVAQLRQMFRTRLSAKTGEIEHSLRQIAGGNPLGAETDTDRGIKRLATKAGIPTRDAGALFASVRMAAKAIDLGGALKSAEGAESMQGPTMDLVGVEFLSRGRLAANAVGRVNEQATLRRPAALDRRAIKILCEYRDTPSPLVPVVRA